MPLRPSPTTARNARRLAGAVPLALLTLGATIAPAAADDSRSYDFESIAAKEWPFRAVNGEGSVTTAPAPERAGTAARFTVPDDGHSFRSELALKGLSAGTHRFGFSHYLPNEWKQVDDDIIVAQWFSTQPDSKKIKPVVALAVHGGEWRLKVHWLKDLATFEEYESVIPLGTVQLGHWNRWALDITWSTPSTPGSITVTRDGVQVGAHRGNNNYHRGEPPHFRTGVYRPAWRPEKPKHPTGGPDIVLFVDDIVITTGPAGAPAPAVPTPAVPVAPTTPAASAPASGAARTSPAAPVSGPAASAPAAATPTASAPAATTSVRSTPPTPTATGTTAAAAPAGTASSAPAAAAPAGPSTESGPATSSPELSSTGASTDIALVGGSVAVVVGTFLLRRRKQPGRHR
ncbi:polysaccharide lyase [Kitasatospora sp. NPDC058201]|uniref:polysaccharide lyase n=1 Tax=unclassified Kitasatospora TaxID=2633591 RepID=UPI0036573D02